MVRVAALDWGTPADRAADRRYYLMVDKAQLTDALRAAPGMFLQIMGLLFGALLGLYRRDGSSWP